MQMTSFGIIVSPFKRMGLPSSTAATGISYVLSWDFLRENIRTTTIIKLKKPKIFRSPQNISPSVPDIVAMDWYT
jgi:hypothetical protein